MAKAKALVADGDLGFAEMLCARLAALGFETVTSGDGVEALRLARGQMPQLLVADEGLATIDGFKLCRLLKFDKPRSKITIVLTSATVTDEGRETAEAVQANGFLAKQVENEELLAIAQELIAPKE